MAPGIVVKELLSVFDCQMMFPELLLNCNVVFEPVQTVEAFDESVPATGEA